MIGRREKNPSSCVIAGTDQFVVVWVMSPGFHCCFLQLLCYSGKDLHCSWWDILSAETIETMHKCVCHFVCVYLRVMVILMQTGSGLSVIRSLQRFLPAVGLCTNRNNHTQAYTLPDIHTRTAGLPVSGDLGWASDTLRGFSHPLILTFFSVWICDQLILLLYLFFSPLSHLIFFPLALITGTRWLKH